jgi:hypothetical protein
MTSTTVAAFLWPPSESHCLFIRRLARRNVNKRKKIMGKLWRVERQGLKPAFVFRVGRGAEAPLFHGSPRSAVLPPLALKSAALARSRQRGRALLGGQPGAAVPTYSVLNCPHVFSIELSPRTQYCMGYQACFMALANCWGGRVLRTSSLVSQARLACRMP